MYLVTFTSNSHAYFIVLFMTAFKYQHNADAKLFLQTLKSRINHHFQHNQITPYANGAMWFKIVFILLLWIGSYAGILSNPNSSWLMGVFIFIHACTHLLIPFNISHDANHQAMSKNKQVNNLLSQSLSLIGVSPFFWKIAHNQEHHSFINVTPIDSNTKGYGVLKFTPEDPHKEQFRYQHWYAPAVYFLTTLNYVFLKEIKMIRSGQYRIPMSAYVELACVKLGYFAYVAVIPYFVLHVAVWKIALAFVLSHFMLGVMLSLVFQCGHFTEDAHYPTVEEQVIQDGWATHTLRTTCDFGTNNRILSALTGGINIHIPHHLFPTICHIHYRDLVPIIKQTAHEFNLPYRVYDSFTEAIVSHLKLLRNLGDTGYDFKHD